MISGFSGLIKILLQDQGGGGLVVEATFFDRSHGLQKFLDSFFTGEGFVFENYGQTGDGFKFFGKSFDFGGKTALGEAQNYG